MWDSISFKRLVAILYLASISFGSMSCKLNEVQLVSSSVDSLTEKKPDPDPSIAPLSKDFDQLSAASIDVYFSNPKHPAAQPLDPEARMAEITRAAQAGDDMAKKIEFDLLGIENSRIEAVFHSTDTLTLLTSPQLMPDPLVKGGGYGTILNNMAIWRTYGDPMFKLGFAQYLVTADRRAAYRTRIVDIARFLANVPVDPFKAFRAVSGNDSAGLPWAKYGLEIALFRYELIQGLINTYLIFGAILPQDVKDQILADVKENNLLVAEELKWSEDTKGIRPWWLATAATGPKMTNQGFENHYGQLVSLLFEAHFLKQSGRGEAIMKVLKGLRVSISGFGTSGFWPEGPAYHQVSAQYYLMACKVSEWLTGSHLGLPLAPEFKLLPRMIQAARGPTGKFANFGDAAEDYASLFVYAGVGAYPESVGTSNASYLLQQLRQTTGYYFNDWQNVYFFEPTLDTTRSNGTLALDATPVQINWFLQRPLSTDPVEAGTVQGFLAFRSSPDPSALWIATSTRFFRQEHLGPEAAGFVLEHDGVRFVKDLGYSDYNYTDCIGENHEHCYANNALGNNVASFGPVTQKESSGLSVISDYSLQDGNLHAVIDLKKAYPAAGGTVLTDYTRTFQLTPGGSSAQATAHITDRFKLSGTAQQASFVFNAYGGTDGEATVATQNALHLKRYRKDGTSADLYLKPSAECPGTWRIETVLAASARLGLLVSPAKYFQDQAKNSLRISFEQNAAALSGCFDLTVSSTAPGLGSVTTETVGAATAN